MSEYYNFPTVAIHIGAHKSGKANPVLCIHIFIHMYLYK